MKQNKIHVCFSTLGWMEFRLCPVNNPTQRATQACLDRNVLTVVDAHGNPQTSQYGSTKVEVSIVFVTVDASERCKLK